VTCGATAIELNTKILDTLPFTFCCLSDCERQDPNDVLNEVEFLESINVGCSYAFVKYFEFKLYRSESVLRALTSQSSLQFLQKNPQS
jgi:hypothetical protein